MDALASLSPDDLWFLGLCAAIVLVCGLAIYRELTRPTFRKSYLP